MADHRLALAALTSNLAGKLGGMCEIPEFAKDAAEIWRGRCAPFRAGAPPVVASGRLTMPGMELARWQPPIEPYFASSQITDYEAIHRQSHLPVRGVRLFW